MRKCYISLFEILCILAITAITGSMATKLFFGFMKENISLEKHQQTQRDFKNIVRSSREWAFKSGPSLDKIDHAIISGSNEINLVEGKVIFKFDEEELIHSVPKGFTVNFDSDTGLTGQGILVIKGERNGLSYCLKLPLGGKHE